MEKGELVASIRRKSTEGVQLRVCFSPDESLLLLRQSQSISLWKTADGEPAGEFSEKSTGRPIAAFAPDGKSFVTDNGRYGVTFWDTTTRKPQRVIDTEGLMPGDPITPATLGKKPVRAPIVTFAFAPSGKHFATGSLDGSVELWRYASGKTLCSEKGHDGTVSALAFSQDGSQLVTGGADTTLIVWSVK